MHPNQKSKFCKLVTRYLTDEGSAADDEKLVEQLQDPEAQAVFDGMRQGWECAPENLEGGFDVDAISRRVAAAIHAEQAEPEEEPLPQQADSVSKTGLMHKDFS